MDRASELKRWHLHFTLASASWLNLVEAWFSVLTRKVLAQNSFSSVADLTETIDAWPTTGTVISNPLAWTKTAPSIIEKVDRAQTAFHDISKTHH